MKKEILATMIILIPLAADGNTWTVTKDGTGQYIEIQDAVDIAATGDTIMIGPGRYDEYRSYSHGTEIEKCIVHIDNKGLIVIGSGYATIIGQAAHPDLPSVDNTAAIWCHSAGYHQHICNLILENTYRGILIQNGTIDINNVITRWCWHGIHLTENTTGVISNCIATNCVGIGMLITAAMAPLIIQNCTYEFNNWGIDVDWMSQGVELRDCTFLENTSLGIQYATTSNGIISNCQVEGSRTGIGIAGSSTVEIQDTISIPSSYWGLVIYNNSSVTGYGNIIRGVGSYPAIWLLGSSITMSESHIIKGDAFAVFLAGSQYGPDYIFDLRNNYWGTTSAEEISAMIWDAADDPAIRRYIEYQPFHDQPVSNENMSFGEIKAMFRR